MGFVSMLLNISIAIGTMQSVAVASSQERNDRTPQVSAPLTKGIGPAAKNPKRKLEIQKNRYDVPQRKNPEERIQERMEQEKILEEYSK
jgi:hypothetical protein